MSLAFTRQFTGRVLEACCFLHSVRVEEKTARGRQEKTARGLIKLFRVPYDYSRSFFSHVLFVSSNQWGYYDYSRVSFFLFISHIKERV